MNGVGKRDLGRKLAVLAQMEQIWDPLWQQNSPILCAIQKQRHPSKVQQTAAANQGD